MSVKIDQMYLTGDDYDEDGNLVLTNRQAYCTIVPFCNGVYFTAAHPFDTYDVDEDPTYNFVWTSASIVSQGRINSVKIPAAYVPIAYANPSKSNFDKSLVVAPADSSQQNSVVFFADQSAVGEYFTHVHGLLSFNGEISTDVGGYPGSVTATGQFLAEEVATQPGDSGGAASVTDGDKSYVVGLLSAPGPAYDANTALFTYLNLGDYDNALKSMTTMTNVPDAVIWGINPNEKIGAGAGHADIITNGDNDVILAGSGGGLINTGMGQNDVIFMPSADGDQDPGTTVVVTPGTMTLVGGTSSDTLAVLADRIDGTASNDLSDTAATIALPSLVAASPPTSANVLYQADSNLGGTGDGFGLTAFYPYASLHGADNYAPNDLVLEYAFTSPDSTWLGTVVIQNYQQGDFGLNLLPYGSAVNTSLGASTSQTGIDDDPSVAWQSDESLSTFFYVNEPPADPSSATIAADLAAVLSNTQGGGSGGSGGGTPPVVSVAALEADQSQLDATAGGFAVADTAAAIAQGFDVLNADNALTGISVSDAATAPLMLTTAEATGDQTALGKLDKTSLTIEVADSAAALGALTPQQIAVADSADRRRSKRAAHGERRRQLARCRASKIAAGWHPPAWPFRRQAAAYDCGLRATREDNR